jgi:integrase
MELKDTKTEHIDGYLQSRRRNEEIDPDQKWISTHNNRAMTFAGFFRFLYFPDLEPEERAKKTPDVVAGVTFFKRKSKTHVKSTHLWLATEDEIFLKYCPDQRVSLYHVMADDTSGRPHELLAKRIGDVKIIKSNSGGAYAEMEIGRGGKTLPRVVPLNRSVKNLAKEPKSTGSHSFHLIDEQKRIFVSLFDRATYRLC